MLYSIFSFDSNHILIIRDKINSISSSIIVILMNQLWFLISPYQLMLLEKYVGCIVAFMFLYLVLNMEFLHLLN